MINMTERSGSMLDGVSASIVSTPGMRGLCGFFLQSSHEEDTLSNITDYGNPTLAECQAIHNHTYEAYLAVSIRLILDRLIYSNLI